MAQYTVTIEPKAPDSGCGGCLAGVYVAGYLLMLAMWFVGADNPGAKDIAGAMVFCLFWPVILPIIVIASGKGT